MNKRLFLDICPDKIWVLCALYLVKKYFPTDVAIRPKSE